MVKKLCSSIIEEQSDNSIEVQRTYLETQARTLNMVFKYYFEKESGKNVENRKSFKALTRKHSRQFQYRFRNYELTGLIRCGYCKGMYVHSVQKRKYGIHGTYVNRRHEKGCKQYNCTFRENIMNGIFRVCFYLLFAHSKQIAEAIREKRKELDEKNMDVNRSITMIKKRLKVVDGKLDKLADAVYSSGECCDREFYR